MQYKYNQLWLISEWWFRDSLKSLNRTNKIRKKKYIACFLHVPISGGHRSSNYFLVLSEISDTTFDVTIRAYKTNGTWRAWRISNWFKSCRQCCCWQWGLAVCLQRSNPIDIGAYSRVNTKRNQIGLIWLTIVLHLYNFKLTLGILNNIIISKYLYEINSTIKMK